MKDHAHLLEPDLVQALLDPGATELRAELERCAECRSRARQLDALVGRWRAALGDERAPDNVIESVLDATTRTAAVLSARPRQLARRLAAAVVLIALGGLAWIAYESTRPLREPERPSDVAIAPPAQPNSEATTESGAEPVDLEERAALDREREAQSLRAGEFPDVADLPKPEERLPLLLWARSRQAHGQRLPVGPVESLPWRAPTGVERALWLELLTDRWVLTGEGLERVRRAADELLDSQTDIGDLELLALTRAHRLGALEGVEERRLLSWIEPRGESRMLQQRTQALDGTWRTALAAAAPRAETSDVVVARWLGEAR